MGARDVPGEDVDLSSSEWTSPTERYEVKIASWKALLGQALTFDTVLQQIRQLPFDATMVSLSALAGALYHARYDTDRHWRLARDVLIEGPVLEAVRRFLEGGSGRIVFDPRYLTIFQRLLVEHASSDSGPLGEEQARIVIACLLALPDVLPETAAAGSNRVVQSAVAALRLGAYHFLPFLPDSIVHAWTMFVELASEVDESHANYCPFEDWSVETSGVALADEIFFGIALLHAARALDPDATLHERAVLIPLGHLAPVVAGERLERLSQAVSATREEFRCAFSRFGETDPRVAWDHTPIELWPFLRCEVGSLLLLSPRALQGRMTRGIYFRMMEAARGAEHEGGTEDSRVERFTRFCGLLAERYVLNLVKRSYEVHEPDPPVGIYGEKRYRVGKSRSMSPDLAIVQPPDLVLVEVFSGRVPLQARVDPTPKDLHTTLEKMLIDKLEQLQDRIAELLEGHLTFQGMGDVATLKIWPVLLLAGEGIALTPIVWSWVEKCIPEGSFSDQRVGPPTICNLDEFERLLVLVERGHLLPALLASFHYSSYSRLPFTNWISDTYDIEADEIATYVDEQFAAISGRYREWVRSGGSDA
jgi:hypothetical protein